MLELFTINVKCNKTFKTYYIKEKESSNKMFIRCADKFSGIIVGKYLYSEKSKEKYIKIKKCQEQAQTLLIHAQINTSFVSVYKQSFTHRWIPAIL